MVRGSTRLPILMALLRSTSQMCSAGYKMTVVLIAAWAAEERREELTESLRGCGAPLTFGIWQNAAIRHGQGRENDLPRKHRFLVRDMLEDFDVFSCWEDDMFITSSHLSHFLRTSAALEAMALSAPTALHSAPAGPSWRAGLTRAQLERIFPALLRVEELRGEAHPDDATNTPTASRQKGWKEKCCSPLPQHAASRVVACSLCSARDKAGGGNLSAGDLVSWEWGAFHMGVRPLPPPVGWVGVASGAGWLSSFTSHGADGMAPACRLIGRQGAAVRTDTGAPCQKLPAGFLGQQGGWMATREQV